MCSPTQQPSEPSPTQEQHKQLRRNITYRNKRVLIPALPLNIILLRDTITLMHAPPARQALWRHETVVFFVAVLCCRRRHSGFGV
jgi:hypothetical protein